MINDFLLNVYKHAENPKEWCVPFQNMDYEEWLPLSANEFIRTVEEYAFWDDVRPEIYEKAFDSVGLDYKSFDDPDEAWTAFLSSVDQEKQKLIAKNTDLCL